MTTENERETHVYMAKLSEQAERYDEMVECMKKVAKLDLELTVEERNLLSVGYKNVIGARRASWRIMSSIEQKEESKGNEQNVTLIKSYRSKVEEELSKICNDILTIIDEHLIPASGSGESTVFYYKMKGDYFRYLAEFKTDQERKDAADQSLKGYEAASKMASTDLSSTHPIRLGLALNFSVFYYEILNSPERACHLAKQSFDEAIADLDTLSEESYKDSTLIMQLLRDNLTLWTSDLPEDGGEDSFKGEEPKAAEPERCREYLCMLVEDAIAEEDEDVGVRVAATFNARQRDIELDRHFWCDVLRDMITDPEARKIIARQIALDEIACEDEMIVGGEMRGKELTNRLPSFSSSSFEMDPSTSSRSITEENIGFENTTLIGVKNRNNISHDSVIASVEEGEGNSKSRGDSEDKVKFLDFHGNLYCYSKGSDVWKEFCKYKSSVTGIWGGVMEYYGKLFRECSDGKGNNMFFLLLDLEFEKARR
ncbi:hypothetical protein GIB67_009516 [Kingdonia uniflora]|uniref:14-3-3 domain-containing protein n=1 Tax=Kingdonia uniflora TaxID=39325 RepID=A0A7J7NVZ4_9MAGN|nr:hypothetical protein GIB67_009516 [Kingdonia uniflora]